MTRTPLCVLFVVAVSCSDGSQGRSSAEATVAVVGSSAPMPPPPRTVTFPERWVTAAEVPFEPAPPTPEVVVEAAEVADEVTDLSAPVEIGDAVLFASGSAVITPLADEILKRLALAAVESLGESQVLVIEGYVDEVGTAEFNEVLAADRAIAVMNRLVREQPALEGRVMAIGHGEDDLLHPDCRGDCPANRTVVIRVQG